MYSWQETHDRGFDKRSAHILGHEVIAEADRHQDLSSIVVLEFAVASKEIDKLLASLGPLQGRGQAYPVIDYFTLSKGFQSS